MRTGGKMEASAFEAWEGKDQSDIRILRPLFTVLNTAMRTAKLGSKLVL